MLLCIVSRSCLCLTRAHPTMSCIPIEVVNLCGHNLDTVHPDWRHRPSAQVQSSSVQFILIQEECCISNTEDVYMQVLGLISGGGDDIFRIRVSNGDRPYAELPIFYCYGNIHNTIKWVGSRSRSDIQHERDRDEPDDCHQPVGGARRKAML